MFSKISCKLIKKCKINKNNNKFIIYFKRISMKFNKYIKAWMSTECTLPPPNHYILSLLSFPFLVSDTETNSVRGIRLFLVVITD